jgi:hypothetical protein
VRGEVLEDVLLARAIRASGARTGIANGAALLAVRMYTNGSQVAEGLAKHALAGLRNGGKRAFWGGTRQFMLALGPLWMLATGLGLVEAGRQPLGWAVLLHGATVMLATLGFWALLLRRIYRQPVAYALLWPFGMLCYGLIALRSAWRVRTGRGVVWKGRTYER